MKLESYMTEYPATDDRSFGRYIRIQREENKLTTRQLGEKIGCSAAYVVDVEKGNRPAPKQFLDKLCDALNIEERDSLVFKDLVSASHGYHFDDITAYVGTKPAVRAALRTAQKRQVPDTVWQDFTRLLEQY